MKSFFAKMSFARSVVLGSVLVALIAAVFGWRFRQERTELADALEVRIPKLAQDIQVLSTRYSRLTKDADFGGSGQDDVQSFVRQVAGDEKVRIGQINVRPPQESTPRKGVKDIRYGIEPEGRDRRTFGRDQIANFLYLIETQNRRMRVTQLQLQLGEKNMKPWETPAGTDKWRWDAEVTIREKDEKVAAAGN